jgi:monoamine oxidase
LLASAKVRARPAVAAAGIQAGGLSDEAIESLRHAGPGHEPDRRHQTIREEFGRLVEADEIVGGTDRLASAFAAKLRPGRAWVVKSSPSRGRPTPPGGVVYRERGVEKRTEGDFVLCTLPFPVLSRLSAQPEFSDRNGAVRGSTTIVDQGAVRVQAPLLGERRRHLRRRNVHGLADGDDVHPSDNAQARDPRVSPAGRRSRRTGDRRHTPGGVAATGAALDEDWHGVSAAS